MGQSCAKVSQAQAKLRAGQSILSIASKFGVDQKLFWVGGKEIMIRITAALEQGLR